MSRLAVVGWRQKRVIAPLVAVALAAAATVAFVTVSKPRTLSHFFLDSETKSNGSGGSGSWVHVKREADDSEQQLQHVTATGESKFDKESDSLYGRKLTTGGVPGEGLLLAVANSDATLEDAAHDDVPGIEEVDYPDPFGDSFEDVEHKPLHPFDRYDYATAVLATMGLMIAAAGGIGGGGILVPMYMLVLHFSPKHAVPLSNITIFGGAITNSILNMKKRHPIADRPLVDWDLILVMEPLTIGGALVGSFIQKVLPEVFLTFMMILLLVATADRTIRKGVKNFKKESADNQERKKGLSSVTGDVSKASKGAKSVSVSAEGLLSGTTKTLTSYGAAVSGNDANDGNGFSPAVLSPEIMMKESVAIDIAKTMNTSADTDQTSSDAALTTSGNLGEERSPILFSDTVPNSPLGRDEAGANNEITLKNILDEERYTSYAKVGIMTAVFSVILVVNLLKGGGGFKSPLGIVCGSSPFWAATIFSFGWVLAVSFRVRKYLINRWELKSKLGYVYAEGDVQWSPLNTLRYPGICFFAGFFAGMFGVGGGIVKGPLMLEMGVHPRVASSTSAVMILFTSFTASTSFVVFGLLRMDYAVPLFFIGLVATAFGQWGTDYLIQKFQRPSFIVLSIGSVVALSAVLMGYNGILDVYVHWGMPMGSHSDNALCSAGV